MTKKVSILILGKLPPPYLGPAVATEILLGSSLRDRYRLSHVDTNVHETLDTLGGFEVGKVVRNLGIYGRFARTLLRSRPDLVLVPISQTMLGFVKDSVFILLGWAVGSRVVVQLRGSTFDRMAQSRGAVGRAYIRAVLAAASGVIVLGESLRRVFERYFPPERIFVVPNGADFTFPDAERNSPDARVRILYLGNLQASKGIEDVIVAVARLRDSGLEGFRVDVVGAWRDPETRQRCVALVEERDLPVAFHGPVTGAGKLRFLADVDIFVFTPREPEGHPWVIVEALAAGLPVVATDRGAIVESVLDGWNGFIVDAEAPAQIADRLERLVADRDLRRRLGDASRRHYLAEFTEARMIERMSAAFDALLHDTAA